jgi:hypothetical protein
MAKGQWGRAVTDDIVIVVVMARAAEPSMRPGGPRDSPVLAYGQDSVTRRQQGIIDCAHQGSRRAIDQRRCCYSTSLLTAKTQLQGSEFLRRYQN